MKLWNFRARQSDDSVKRDLELRCDDCGQHLCDIEDGDCLESLVGVANDHACKGWSIEPGFVLRK